MNNSREQRYEPHQHIISFPEGALHYGKDVSLQRPVLLYTTECRDESSAQDYIQRFSKASSFIHDGFHHILDTSCDHNHILIVLAYRQGGLLLEKLNKERRSFATLIGFAADLGVSMLDALEEQITGYSIDLDNIWLSEDGRLSVINYWDEGNPQNQGAIGLCRLLVQLLTGTTEIPGPFEALHTHLERSDLPQAAPEQKDFVVKLIKRVSQGQASLSSLVFELRSLTPTGSSSPAGSVSSSYSTSPASSAHAPQTSGSASSPGRKRDEAAPKPAPAAAGYARAALPKNASEAEDEHLASPSWLNRRFVWSAASTVLAIILVWVLWPSSSDKPASVQPNPSMAPVATAAPSPTVAASPSPSGANANDRRTEPAEEIMIPTLIGLDQAEAEQQALASGLHYHFVLEKAEQAPGKVFKQDPQPETKAYKGDNITFWVSKGSQ